ncbi:MAG: hypothetical protein LBT46_08280, partial [Planctomycetaceae bacterium]|nr:hypothetical protein [Planctomycetaceae bacterium]
MMADLTTFNNTESQAANDTIELNAKAYHLQKSEVGEVRPSQLMTTFGIGSLVDLPNLSVIVMGQDDWNINYSTEIAEKRLLRAAQSVVGSQVARFLSAPRGTDTQDKFSSESLIGVPVAPFPRWLICTKCRLLAPINSGLFEPKNDKHPDRVRYVHSCTTQGQHPLAIPARFMTVCEHGHLDDFPWLEFVHGGKNDCKGELYLYEVGASGEAVDVELE